MFVTYPAVFYYETSGEYSILFPDFEGATQGKDKNSGYKMAIDFIGMNIADLYINNENLPIPTNIEEVEIEVNEDNKEYTIKEKSFKTLIAFDLVEYIKTNEKKTIRKNVSLPSWLNEIAKNNNLNFSKLLQRAVKEELGI